jgi:mRNA interferase HigB
MPMRVISRSALRKYWESHPNAKASLVLWYERITTEAFEGLVALRQVFRSADKVGNFVVFNIAGNHHRLITYIDYEAQIVFIRDVLTHAEYDKEDWKDDDWYQNS